MLRFYYLWCKSTLSLPKLQISNNFLYLCLALQEIRDDKMTRKERYKYILDYFRKNVGEVSTELMFGSAFQLLCATVLSAQCTDKRINAITPALFSKYPDAKTMATADVEDVFEFVRSVSYPHTKAKHLVEMARMIEEEYGGEYSFRSK